MFISPIFGGIVGSFVKSNVHLISKRMSSSTNKCAVAVCQFTATNNVLKNLEIVKRLVNNAAQQNAKVVFLPEATDYIAENKKEAKSLAEPLNGTVMNEYKNMAKSNNVWLSVGLHEKVDEDTVYNTHALIDNSGEIKSLYRKIHLFDVSLPEKNIFLRESDLNVGGSQILPPTDTPAGRVALAICYDLRFPELSILQTKLGADILTYPSAFTHTTGAAHWEVLLRARAIENQCYVVAAALCGKHNAKRISYGHSMIVDPWGKIIAHCPKYNDADDTDVSDESVAIGEIDLGAVIKVREEMPIQTHRRQDVYSLNLIKSPTNVINDHRIFSFSDKKILGSTVFFKTKYSFAFTNIRCVVPGHVLVASIRVVKRLFDLSEDELADLFQTAVKVQRAVETEHKASSSTLCIQDGPSAGQSVPHVHIHVMPRKTGDFAENDDIYFHLANHDRDTNLDPFRKEEEMVEESHKLRKYFI